MATVANILDSARYDLRAKTGNAFENEELLDYLNRSVGVLDSNLLSLNSDWLKKVDAIESLSTGQRKITMPTRCIGIDERGIWRTNVVSALTDLTFTKSTKIILSTATNFTSAGFAVNDIIGIGGSTLNDSEDIGLVSIASIGDDGAGTNNEITINESTLVDEGSADASGTIIRVDRNEVYKSTNQDLHFERKWGSPAAPYYWAWEGTDIIFDNIADQAYGLIIHFSQKSDTLQMSSSMPYNDEFNQEIRQGVVIIGENVYDEFSQLSAALERLFKGSARTKQLNRSYVKRHRRDF